MDPPYRQNLPGKTLEIISKKNVLKDNGIVVVEHEKKLSLGNRILNLIRTDERDYGDKIISFYSLITEGEIK
jgi:16S rRNA G966 N2-methylase RsmD